MGWALRIPGTRLILFGNAIINFLATFERECL
jgi:hypothetical protein